MAQIQIFLFLMTPYYVAMRTVILFETRLMGATEELLALLNVSLNGTLMMDTVLALNRMKNIGSINYPKAIQLYKSKYGLLG
ncbi:hypothetical protein L596_026621 [Steinernema carpocapsae]|uniref:Uncharacterized protein n=1 Tax=Steinernema carpocapsae TaxID=34508 RepID=A0A4U5M1W9_STECR|nr:hypothetical protein L596_026621 [Steinernema carpocapsae]